MTFISYKGQMKITNFKMILSQEPFYIYALTLNFQSFKAFQVLKTEYRPFLAYQFVLATIFGFREHWHVTQTRTNRNQLVDIYLMLKDFREKVFLGNYGYQSIFFKVGGVIVGMTLHNLVIQGTVFFCSKIFFIGNFFIRYALIIVFW